MRRYRKIDPRIWNDAKFMSLSDGEKLVFFMLLTHPNMTALGAMRATLSGLAEELGWQPEAFREAFAKICRKGMAEHDPKACLITLPKFIKYNPPESPNVIKAWASALDLLPECNLKTRVIAGAKAYAEGLTEGFAKALPEAFAKSMPYQEQEQEQEQEKEGGSIEPDAGKPASLQSSSTKLDYSSWPEMPSPQVLTDWLAMRKRLKANVSQTVINQFGKELWLAYGSGYTVDDCLGECITSNWKGFKFSWLKNREAQHAGNQLTARPTRSQQAEQAHRDYIAELDRRIEREEAEAAGGYVAGAVEPPPSDRSH